MELSFLLFLFCVTVVKAKSEKEFKGYESLGCWISTPSRGFAEVIPSVEQLVDDENLDGVYWERDQAVLKCAWLAKDHGYEVFAVRSSGECLTSANASQVYKYYGKSDDCQEGEGGHGAMDVYILKGKLPEIAVLEGDILLNKAQKAMVIPIPFGDVYNDAIFKKVDENWPERIIPYFVHPKYKNHQLERKLLDGLKPWEKETCIKFVPKKNHRDWVEFVREKNPESRRCASAIGHNGNKQQMRMGDLCPAGSVIHEWGHSIGLWHTHSRSDRDKYVKILWNNIFKGWKSQFEKRNFNTYGVKYDYNSIMHYGKNFFAKVSEDKTRLLTTIETLDKKYEDKIGQREKLAKGDVDFVNTMYGCPDFPFMWKAKDWGECSSKCGRGTQIREFICAKKDGKKVEDVKCKNTRRPESKRTCYGRKCSECPGKWHRFKEACYQLQFTKAGWKEARKSCLSKGADLVSLRSKEEDQELRRYIVKNGQAHTFFWIGAEYHPVDGAFKWVSDDTNIEFNDWKKGEPRFGMDCAILLNRQYWGTDQCLMERNYVCKKELRNYVMPKVKLTDQTSKYKWYAGAWGKCSVTCGGGQKNRDTYCSLRPNGEHVHYSKCKGTPPDAWKDCNKQPCPSPYKWHVKNWEECSVTCGGGWQRREVICAKEDMLPTSYDLCNHTKQPEFQQKCNTQPCPPKPRPAPQAPQQPQWPQQGPQQFPQQQTQQQRPQQWPTSWQPQWKTSHWTHCSAKCGIGRQLRQVVCVSTHGKRLEHKLCQVVSGYIPVAKRKCKATKKCLPNKVKHRCRDKKPMMCHFWRRRHQCNSSKVRKLCNRSCRVCQ